MRAEYVLLLLALLAVLCAVLAVWLPAEAECYAVCSPMVAGGNCNCEPDPPISEQHSPVFWLYLPKVAGVGL